eukprot:scaffold48461_cov35-Tisochrysis_lutea.AAC.2
MCVRAFSRKRSLGWPNVGGEERGSRAYGDAWLRPRASVSARARGTATAKARGCRVKRVGGAERQQEGQGE